MKHTLEKNEVESYILEGHTLKETAYHFNVNYSSITRFCRRYNIWKRPPKKPQFKDLELIAKGRTVRQIADILKLPPANVRYYLDTYNISYICKR